MKSCKDGHTLEVIYWHSLPFNEEPTVRWCSNCGAIVVDVDYDGRTKPGAIMKMQWPNILKELIKGEIK